MQHDEFTIANTELVCALQVEAMTAIRNISEGRLRPFDSPSHRTTAVNAISEVAHNLHPNTPVYVVVAAFERECQRAPEAFAMLHQLSHWVQENKLVQQTRKAR